MITLWREEQKLGSIHVTLPKAASTFHLPAHW